MGGGGGGDQLAVLAWNGMKTKAKQENKLLCSISGFANVAFHFACGLKNLSPSLRTPLTLFFLLVFVIYYIFCIFFSLWLARNSRALPGLD